MHQQHLKPQYYIVNESLNKSFFQNKHFDCEIHKEVNLPPQAFVVQMIEQLDAEKNTYFQKELFLFNRVH